jgi:hypothetical protein
VPLQVNKNKALDAARGASSIAFQVDFRSCNWQDTRKTPSRGTMDLKPGTLV